MDRSKIVQALKNQYAQGEPYRAAFGGLLQGDIKPLVEALNQKTTISPMTNDKALSMAMDFAPLGFGVVKNLSQLKALEKSNKLTAPKVPVENVFFNKQGSLSPEKQLMLNQVYESNLQNKFPMQDINFANVVPTQKNINIDNLKRLQNLKNDNTSDAVTVVKQGENYYLVDGHHRIINKILGNEKSMNMRVIE